MTCTLYRYFNQNNDLLYVGIARNATVRLYEHSISDVWYSQIAFATFQHFPDRAAAVHAEKIAIRNEKPQFNSPKPRWGKNRKLAQFSFNAPKECNMNVATKCLLLKLLDAHKL